jgi:hypothetical protein
MKTYTLYKSKNSSKKYDVYVENKKTGRIKKVSFGAKGYEDYTVHHDKERRERYRQRHKHDKIRDPLHAGFWSYWVLWGESTSVNRALAQTKKKFKLKSTNID